jgi:ATP-dependent helicase HrpB
LWTRDEDYSLTAFHPPEILAVDLAGLALELALWGVGDPQELRWLDLPRFGPYQQALNFSNLGAISAAGRITETGRQVAGLPIHPRLGHMLLMAKDGDMVRWPATWRQFYRSVTSSAGCLTPSAELGLRLQLLELWRQRVPMQRAAKEEFDICRRIDRDSRRFQNLIDCQTGRDVPRRSAIFLLRLSRPACPP